MLSLLLLAAAVSTASPVQLAEAERAIAAGRLDQARTMIASALANGNQGEAVDRLLADLAFASRRDGEALLRYKALLVTKPDDSQLVERAAIAALRIDDFAQGKAFADRAIAHPAASWSAWNARAIVADREQDFATADSCYERALALAPDRAEVLTNVGWSHILRGDWQGAIDPLERAVAQAPDSVRAINNLDLVRTALSSDLPQRRPGESDDAWASRLNDAGVAAQLRGDRAKAVAGFSRALETRGSWYERAANNLANVNDQQ
jgi:tetratricopeptide (TPR) repeat protein